MQIPLGKRTYKTRTLHQSAQQCVNCYPEMAQDVARSDVVIYGTEGLANFTDTGETIITNMHVMANELYAVASDRLKKIGPGGDVVDLGQIPGSTRPDMAASNTELVVVRDGRAFVWDGGTLDEITDPDFRTPATVTYMDGRFIFAQADSQVMFHSELLDAKSYDPAAFASAEGREDDLIRPFNDHGDLILAGRETMEIWGNDGGSPLSFSRRGDSFVERGLGASFSMAAMDNSFYWLGDDRLFYRLQGYQPQVISDDSVGQAVQEMDIISDAFAFTYDYARHKFYVCVFPSEGRTFVFDSATNMWHERRSWQRSRWRGNAYAEAYGKRLVGDAFSGKIFFFDDETYTEDNDVLERETITPPIHAGTDRITINRLEMLFEKGSVEIGAQNPKVMVDWSDEAGKPGTFVSEREVPVGKIGQHSLRAKIHRLGQFYDRVFRVRMTDPIPFALVRMDVEAKSSRG